MKRILLVLGILVLSFPCAVYACNTTGTETPLFTIANLGTFKSDINNQILTPSVTPNRYGTIINNCVNSGSNIFGILGGSSTPTISTTDVLNINSRTYFRITNSSTPTSANPAEIYIAFSVRDNQDSAQLFSVNNGNQITMFTGVSATRGMRLESVSVLIRGTNMTPGTYSISNIILGTYTATGSQSASKSITIPSLTYTINSSTCTLNSPIVNLPSMRISDFPISGAVGGATTLTITANCKDDAVNTSYSATITDNYTAASNQNGILLNGISSSSGGSNIKIKLTDTSNVPIPIGPLNLNNKFAFGTLSSSKSVSKTFNASYFADVIPVTPGIVKSVSVINLIYD
ncbi:hypothetical protein KXJ74_09145 [Acinetobacter johnsonii]|nr:hypothetical protein KXJ74_09145 [Acinetobacter johnsonii]